MKEELDFQSYTHPKRDTVADLVKAIITQDRDAGDMEHIDPILDYILPNEHDISSHEEMEELTDYRFDVVPQVKYGGSEGIYVDVQLHGRFDDSRRTTLHLATIKTLSEDIDACKRMGELCGVILYHATRYINKNIHRYTPYQELETEYWRNCNDSEIKKG